MSKLARHFTYGAKLFEDSEGYGVSFPDVPEAFGSGGTREEALASAAEGLAEALLIHVERGDDLPVSKATAQGIVSVSVPAQTAAKLAVWQAWKRAGISKSELADRLGVGENEARRILDPDHRTSLPRLEAALAALGQRLVIGVEDAA